jgi:DNA-binding MarR family transcriptional regulator
MDYLKELGIDLKKDKFEEAALYAVACVYALAERKISDYLRPYNLTPAKFNAMMVIKHQGKEKGLSQIEIGRRLIVSASNMTRLLDKLDKEGYIKWLEQKGDRRVNLVKISKKGAEILDRLWPGYLKKTVEITSLLEKEELNQASGLLLKWFAKLKNNTDAHPPER